MALTHSVLTLQPSGVFFTDEESRAHHQAAPLQVVTFVPEWNFDKFLVFVLFSSSFCFPSGVRPLYGYISWHLPHLCQTMVKVTFGSIGDDGFRDVSVRVSEVNKRPGR